MRTGNLLLAVVAASGWSAVVAAAEPDAPRNQVELGASDENLTKGLPNWRSQYLEWTRQGSRDRQVGYAGLRQTSRFGQDDSEAYGGWYQPLGQSWTAVVEGSASPTYNVLARYTAGGQLLLSLPDGWGAGIGLRHMEYATSGVNVGSLSAEKYFGNFRAAYTLYSGRPEGAPSAASHRFQLSYYYGDDNSVGLSYVTGREVENVGPPTGIITSDVRAWGLIGRHWFTPAWGVSYEVIDHEQGTLYRRQGFRLGLRNRF